MQPMHKKFCQIKNKKTSYNLRFVEKKGLVENGSYKIKK